MLASVGEPLGELDGGDDARVRSASADVALHGAADFGFGGMRRFAQQSGGGKWRVVGDSDGGGEV